MGSMLPYIAYMDPMGYGSVPLRKCLATIVRSPTNGGFHKSGVPLIYGWFISMGKSYLFMDASGVPP